MKNTLLTGSLILGLTGALLSPGQAQLKSHPLSGRIGSGPAYFTPVTGTLETGSVGVSIVDAVIDYADPTLVTTFASFTDLYGSPFAIAANTTVVFDKNNPLFVAQVNVTSITDPNPVLNGTIAFFGAGQTDLGTLPFQITNGGQTTSVPEPGTCALVVSLSLSGAAFLRRRRTR